LTVILGIDPGMTGGIALIESGNSAKVLFAGHIPTTGDLAKKRVNVLAVLAIIQKYKPNHGFIERAQAMPSRMQDGRLVAQGASSGFNYGRAVGALEASVQGSRVPLTIIESTAWKRAHGLIKPQGVDGKEWAKVVKENSRQRALMLFPDAALFFARRLDHGPAEAVLIAHYGLQYLAGAFAPAPKATIRGGRQLNLLER